MTRRSSASASTACTQFQDEGRTIVVVSHAADLMRQHLRRGWRVLDHGDLVALAQPGEAIRTFRERLHAEEVERRERLESRGLAGDAHTAHGFTQEERKSLEVRITSVELDHPGRADRPYLLPGEPLSVRVSYESERRIDDVVFGFAVYDLADGRHLYGANTEMLGVPIPFVEGAGEVVFDIASVPLLDGTYPITLGDPQPRRRHRLRLERAASLVRSDEPREDDRHGRAAGEGEGDRLTAADGEVDLDVVIAEIYDAVAQRRASGELPADLEAELDAEFANYAPSAVTGDSLSGVLSQADKAVTIDVDVPTAGKFPAGQVKKGVRKLTFWYMQYLANQVSSFGSATVRALRMLDRRVSIVEQSTPGASRAVASALEAMDPVPVPAPTAEVIADQLRGAKGRVLHAECGEGDLVRHLAQAGFDVYGVEPRRRLLAPALREGLEIRPDGATDHLTSIAPGALGALVLSGLDTKPTGAQVHLADLAARAPSSRAVASSSWGASPRPGAPRCRS